MLPALIAAVASLGWIAASSDVHAAIPAQNAIKQLVLSPQEKQCVEDQDDDAAFGVSEAPVGDKSKSALLVRASPGPCGFCSPTGNCGFWVLGPKGDTYSVVLSTFRVQSFKVLDSVSHGYPDLELSAHESAFESTHVIYQFDGQRYRRTKCSEWNYQDERDFGHVLDKPRITSLPCDKEDSP